MSDIIPATHITEFVDNSAGGIWHGTCGETSLCVAMGAARGFPVPASMIDSVTHDLINRGWADANGASYMNTLAEYAREKGYAVLFEKDYSGDTWDAAIWHPVILEHAGVNPIVVNIARGGNLYDVETGAHDEAGVQYHVICIVGKQSDGYVVNDGDNWQVGQRFQVYSFDDLQAAMVCGMIVIQREGDHSMTLPSGWTDANGVITAPNGHTVHGNLGAWLRAHPDFIGWAGQPRGEEQYKPVIGMDPANGSGWEQYFDKMALVCFEHDVNGRNAGDVETLWLPAMVDVLNQEVADLNTKLAAVPPSVPVPSPVAPSTSPKGNALLAALTDYIKG